LTTNKGFEKQNLKGSDDEIQHSESLGLIQRTEFQITTKTTFRKLDLFLSSGAERETRIIFSPLEELTTSVIEVSSF
jgi:hypothetical protein